jgi:hypothetical protein
LADFSADISGSYIWPIFPADFFLTDIFRQIFAARLIAANFSGQFFLPIFSLFFFSF